MSSPWPRFRLLPALLVVLCAAGSAAWAGDLRITIPRHSELTPVQRLNRQGVEAVRRGNYDKAEALFYQAYLYDFSDPFTLNNLGYIAELKGDLEQAEKFYQLAEKQECGAVIALSSAKQLQGQPMMYALGTLENQPMRVDRMNVEAVGLLSQGRTVEAELLLRQALALQPRDPFTLNNLGVADAASGNLQGALSDYDAAAATGSMEPIVVTVSHSWRGRPVSEAAADSARDLRQRMRDTNFSQSQATMLAVQGVSAANQNDWNSAEQDFMKAYRLDPNNAFALNNRGYVAEKEGDLETAQFYYAKARRAWNGSAHVGLATKISAEGESIAAVATDSNGKVDGELDAYSLGRRGQPGPVELIPRGANSGEPGVTSAQPSQGSRPSSSSTQPQQ